MMGTITGGPFQSMQAIGSGTSLLPSSTPAYMKHWMKRNWMLMLHAELKAGLNHQGGPRGINKAESQNWLMLMAERPMGPGRLMARGMFSAEPWTAPNRGFPQLFQTGETYQTQPIIDAQHPHDLFMELAANYSVALTERIALNVYGGPVGEPALGPTAFMHRASAAENPASPLGHHLQDSTHISHGVMTAGATLWRAKVEGSVFRGAEPDENRKDIEMGKLDSWSWRVWLTPTKDWVMQASSGYLTTPDAYQLYDLRRTTASIGHNLSWEKGNWATSLVWGRDKIVQGQNSCFGCRSVRANILGAAVPREASSPPNPAPVHNHRQIDKLNSYLLESTVNFLDRNYLYTRVELVDKSGLSRNNVFDRFGFATLGDLPLPLQASGRLPFHFLPNFAAGRVGAITLGGVRDILADSKLRLGVGADVTLYNVPQVVKSIYSANPKSFHVFLRIRPGRID
ncbi:MAG TPA: hypothetical protein VGL91_14070 [Acidobacteriota bacterium]|jgi:hypothetical protein